MGQWTKNIGFCQILSGRNVKSEFYVSLGKLWGEFFFVTINLIYYLRTSSEFFCLFVENLLDVAVITTICTSMGRFWWNLQFFQRNYFFYHLRIITDVHQLSGKISGRFAENAIFVSTETFWGEVFLWKTSLLPLLSHIDREFFGQLSVFLTVSLKLHSICIEKKFEQEIMKNWYFFIFSDFERSFSRFFLKICQRCCQNWFLHPQRNVLWKNVFVEKNYNFLSLSHIGEKGMDFVKTVLAWIWKLHSVCPLEYFEEKVLFWSGFFRLSPLDKGELLRLSVEKN